MFNIYSGTLKFATNFFNFTGKQFTVSSVHNFTVQTSLFYKGTVNNFTGRMVHNLNLFPIGTSQIYQGIVHSFIRELLTILQGELWKCNSLKLKQFLYKH